MSIASIRQVIWSISLKLAVLAGSVALSLVIAEALLCCFPSSLPLGMRAFRDFKQEHTMPDDVVWARGIPNYQAIQATHPEYRTHIQHNSLGFRDSLDGGRAYAVIVGDSFTYGTGVEAEECFVERLESFIGEPVVNLGMGGYGPSRYVRTLSSVDGKFSMQIVFFAIFANDLQDEERYSEFLSRPRPRVPSLCTLNNIRNKEAVLFPLVEFKSWPIGVYKLLSQTRVVQLAQWNFATPAGQQAFMAPLKYNDRLISLEFNESIGEWVDPNKGGKEQNWRLLTTAIRDANMFAIKHGATLVMLNIPTKEEVYVRQRLACGGSPAFDQLFLQWRNRLQSIAYELNVRYFDLAPGLQKAAEEEQSPMYFCWDGHWTSAGHKRAAELIKHWLENQSLLPTDISAQNIRQSERVK